jgi:hypothetical protein
MVQNEFQFFIFSILDLVFEFRTSFFFDLIVSYIFERRTIDSIFAAESNNSANSNLYAKPF